jgi:glutamate N-acetyltransferase / amino-acid N-acetyltransferase
MAVGESSPLELHPVAGVRLGTTSAGIKTPGRLDLVIVEVCKGANVAGVFTRNAFCAAPVQIAKKHLASTDVSHFMINTGNANAGTGELGLNDSIASCDALAHLVGVKREGVLPFSTGVIGEPLPVDKITNALPEALVDLSESGWAKAAEGIKTTDTREKGASAQFQFEGQTITVTGIAKGSGMIKPNMATMLAYIATDATVEQQCLHKIIKTAADASFNRITIDGDTSTNDACMLIATGRSPVDGVTDNTHALFNPLVDAITSVFIELAQGLVRDGEGASKFVTVEVCGGNTEQECLQVAYTVAESPLVKTALFASDPNWGRLLMAIGRADVDQLDVNRVTVSLNDVLIAEQGCRAASYTEEQGAAVMANEEITIVIDLARGEQKATVWTSDLSYDYVRINAEYRT